MEKKTDNGRKWWLYGAIVSLLGAVTGVVLLLFVFNDKKSHGGSDDDDETELVAKTGNWFDLDDEDEADEADEDGYIKEADGVEEKDLLDKDIDAEPDVQQPVGGQNGPDATVYDAVDQMPLFPGEVNVWLGQNLTYPPAAEANGVQGTVVCQFVVEKDGSLSDITVLRSVDPLLDTEAVRAIKQMPLWSPGMKDGQPVRVKFTLPISFKLQ